MSSLVLAAGCAGPKSGSGSAQEFQDLSQQVTELQLANTSHQRKIEELNHWLFLLQDKVDSNRVSLSRRESKPELKVVKLEPPEARPEPAPAVPKPASSSEPAATASEDGGGEPEMLTNKPMTAGDGSPVRSRAERVARNQAAVESYQTAYTLLEQGEVNQAVLRFSRFVEDFRESDLADNALYWTGEAYYDQKEYALALSEFQRVVSEYPEGNKVPDALLKSALCLTELKDQTRARNALYQLVDLYPSSEAARVAQQRLADLK